MPNIRPSNSDLTLDSLRRQPGKLIFPDGLAELGIFKSYDAISRAVEAGKLPEPYRIGLSPAWEGRAVLRMLGASAAIPDADETA